MIRESASPEETFELARELASKNPGCPAYYLEGDLGAGKTLFTKSVADYYGVDRADVVSPTFSLVNRYGGGERVIYHVDLYRLDDEREVDELGLDEMEEEEALVVVEWPEKLGARRRGDAIVVHLEVVDEHTRRIRIDE